MARKLPLLEGHVAISESTLDRFSIGPDNKLYLDNEKVQTQSLVDAYRGAKGAAKLFSRLAALAAFLATALLIVDRAIVVNDKFCWIEAITSSDAACAATAPQGGSPGGEEGDSTG